MSRFLGSRRLARLAAGLALLVAALGSSVISPAPTLAAGAGDGGAKVRPDLRRHLHDHAGSSVDAIVRLQPSATPAAVASMARAHRAKRSWTVIPGFSATLTPAQVTALGSDPAVASVDIVHKAHATLATARKWFGVDAAHNAGYTGLLGDNTHPSNIAVIDTGIDTANPELGSGKVIHFENCIGSCVSTAAAFDDAGHGTHVSGIAAGLGVDSALQGVAPSAGLVGLKVLDKNGNGLDSDVVTALDWVKANHVAWHIGVVNMSIGITCSPCDGTDAASVAVEQLWAAGVVVVVAAGNSGPGVSTVDSPAVAHHVISVGAMSDVTPGPTGFSDSPNAGFYLAPWSSRGPTGGSSPRAKPEISAPGVAITSACSHGVSPTNPNGDGCPDASTQSITLSGTSMASPFVAGTIALMRAVAPALSPDQLLTMIQTTAIPWGRVDASAPMSNEYGAGRLDAAAAVAAAVASISGPASITPPAVPQHTYVHGTSTAGQTICWAFAADGTFPSTTATLIVPGSGTSPNLNLYLRKTDNTLIASSSTSSRQDLISSSTLTTGTYHLEVKPVAATGTTSFDLDVSNAASLVACDPTLHVLGFTATDAGATSTTAAAAAGYTDGPMTVAFTPSTGGNAASQWMVTVDDPNPGAPTPPDPAAAGWNAMNVTSFNLGSVADGAHTLYPWLKDSFGTVTPAADAAANKKGITLDTSVPQVSLSSPLGGSYPSRQTLQIAWSTAGTLPASKATVSYLSGSTTSTLATAQSSAGTLAWKTGDVPLSGATFKVMVASPGGKLGSATSAPINVFGLGGLWVDNKGAIHRYGSQTATVAETPRWTFSIARGMTLLPSGAGGYVLDGYGGVHPFGIGGAPAPPAFTGGPYFSGFDIARDVVLRPAGGGYVLDGFGGIHPASGAPAVSDGPYFGFDIARKLVLAPGGGGYLLDGYGGVHPFGGAPPLVSGPYFGWDIARSMVLSADGQTGYLLDGYGGIHPLTFAGATHAAPAASGGPSWRGWDIARGLTLLPDGSGGYVLDGYGGVQPFGLGGPTPPRLPETGYLGYDGARGVSGR